MFRGVKCSLVEHDQCTNQVRHTRIGDGHRYEQDSASRRQVEKNQSKEELPERRDRRHKAYESAG